MNKYIAYQHNGSTHLIPATEVAFVPAGWHKPYKYQTLDDMAHYKHNPAEKRPALIHLPGLLTKANNARIVDDATCAEIDKIDAQILALKQQRRALYRLERFYFFALVQEGDVGTSTEPVYATKAEADASIK